MQWVNSGYFHENVLIRTENDQGFHPIGEWFRLCGGKVFILLVYLWVIIISLKAKIITCFSNDLVDVGII